MSSDMNGHDGTTPLGKMNGAICLQRSEWGTVRVTGDDRVTWLNGLLTCDVASVSLRQGAFGFLLTKQGKIQAELQLLGTEHELFIGVSGGAAASVRDELDRYLVMEDADLELLEDHVWWALHGPGASGVASSLSGLVSAVGAIDWTARGGAAAVAVRSASDAVEQALQAQGVEIVTDAEWEALRIRWGLPRFGVDYGSSDNPHAASLERRAVSWTKGCYLGQEVVCMQDMRGKVKRRLMRLQFGEEPRGETLRGLDVTSGGQPVGTVTSHAGCFALASLRAPADTAGTEVTVGGLTATVRALAAEPSE